MSATFAVECLWPDVRREQVEAGAARVRRNAGVLSSSGVAFRGLLLLLEDEVVFYLFEGTSADVVGEACRQAAIPFERILDAVHLLDTAAGQSSTETT